MEVKQKKGYIKIENSGEIEPQAFTLMGATDKRNTNKIGYFGSGLKYALAVLLRNEIGFRIYSGEKEIKFKTELGSFRNVPIHLIKVNGRKTNMTTEMGPDWKSWFAVRELYCNALDEGDCVLGLVDEPKGEIGKTIVYIEYGKEVKELFENWNEFFSNKRKDIVLTTESKEEGGIVYSGSIESVILYRRGVQAYKETGKSLFHYDLPWLSINESRVASDTWQIQTKIPTMLAIHATEDMIKTIFNNYKRSFESRLYWHYVAKEFNQNWLKVINKRAIVKEEVSGYFVEEISDGKAIMLPSNLVSALKSCFPEIKVLGKINNKDNGYEIDMTDERKKQVEDVMSFLKRGNIEIDAPIKIWQFENKRILGEAKDGEIRLAPNAFEDGRRTLARVILEEASHLESGMCDYSRGFQNYLFGRILNLLEDKVQEKL